MWLSSKLQARIISWAYTLTYHCCQGTAIFRHLLGLWGNTVKDTSNTLHWTLYSCDRTSWTPRPRSFYSNVSTVHQLQLSTQRHIVWYKTLHHRASFGLISTSRGKTLLLRLKAKWIDTVIDSIIQIFDPLSSSRKLKYFYFFTFKLGCEKVTELLGGHFYLSGVREVSKVSQEHSWNAFSTRQTYSSTLLKQTWKQTNLSNKRQYWSGGGIGPQWRL